MWAADKGEAARNIIFLFTGILVIFFMVFYFNNLNYLKWLYITLLLIFVALLPIGIWETVTGNHLPNAGLFGIERLDLAFMPSTFFRNPNDYAAYIAITIPMFLVWVRYHEKLLGRTIGLLMIIMGLWVLLMTMSRSSYIALFMGTGFWLIFMLQLKSKIKVVSVVTALLILLALAIPGKIQDSLTLVGEQVSSLSSVYADDDAPDVRKNLIKNGLYFAVQSVGFGVGAGNVEYYMENSSIYPVGRTINIHNWWAEILVNYGVFIFVGYVILYVTLVLNLWRAYKKVINRTEKMICEALLVGLVSFFMASISSSSIIAFPPQWIFFGFALAFFNYTRIKALERRNPDTF
jgi:teichuronic acid biosynthesis protein TuaE